MQRFLAQYKDVLTPMQLIILERAVLTTADRMIVGYNGGEWHSKQVGKHWALTAPREYKSALGCNDSVNNATSETIGVAVAFIANNHVWHSFAERNTIGEKAYRKFEAIHFGIHDAVFSKKGVPGVNADHFYTLTD